MGKAARAARVSVVLVFAFSGLHSTKRGPLQAAVTYSSKGEALSDGKQTAARTTRDRSGVHLVRAEPTCTRKPRMIKCPQRGVDDDATPAEWRNGRRSGLKSPLSALDSSTKSEKPRVFVTSYPLLSPAIRAIRCSGVAAFSTMWRVLPMSTDARRAALAVRIQQLLDARKREIARIVANCQRPRLRIIDRAFAEYR